MRRCQIFNTLQESLSFRSRLSQGCRFYAGLRERVSYSGACVPWDIPFTFAVCSVHDASATVLTPAAGERHGGRFARPHAPGIALKTAAARYAPLRLHLAEASLTGRWPLAVPQQPDGGDKGIASRRFSCRNAGFPRPGETGLVPFTCRAGNSSVRNLT